MHHITIFAVLLGVSSVAAGKPTKLVGGSPEHPSLPAPPSQPATFPTEFMVSTGTTVPFADIDPIAQSGAMYFDLGESRARIDNYWMGNQRSFIADLKRQRGYLLSNSACFVSTLTGSLLPFGVPMGSIRDSDAHLVRGVPVTRYTKSGRGASLSDEKSVYDVDFFIRKMNLSYVSVEDGSVKTTSYNIPWRLTSRRSHRKEIAGAPQTETKPNWRFFGEPIVDDALIRYEASSHKDAISRALGDIPITVDFYNFVPMVPDANIFEPPATCVEPPVESFGHDVDLVEIERHLMDLSFTSDHGRRVMDEIYSNQKGPEVKAAP